MSLSRVKTWISGEVLTASDLNAEFNNIINNAPSLVSPMGGSLLFSPDATYDVGASGATRPRDFYLSRNAVIGGTLGVTGNTTLSGTLGVTGAVTLTGGAVNSDGANVHVAGGLAKNAIINGDFSVAQRGTSFTSATTPANSDDTYLLDRWTLLSDGNDIVDVTQNTATVPTNGLFTIALDVESANKKFGIIQFIEQKNCKGFIGNTCTLSFKARKGASNSTVGTMRAVIYAWDGTADTVTSDVVSAWGVSGTNPTPVANWTAENTAADLTLTTAFQTFSVSAAIDTASAKNIAVFLYYNNADGTVADFIYITDVQLEVGSVATPFCRRDFADELRLCQRHYEKTFAYATAPAQAVASFAGAIGSLPISGSTGPHANWFFKERKFATPTITTYNPTQANANWRNEGDTADVAFAAGHIGQASVMFTAGAAGASTTLHYIHAAAVAEL